MLNNSSTKACIQCFAPVTVYVTELTVHSFRVLHA